MDRKKLSRATHGITFRQRVGTAQNLFLSTNQVRLGGAGAFTLTGEAQRACLLEALTIEAKLAGAQSAGLISEISVGGQSAMVSDQSACISAFSATSFNASARSLGISVNNNMKLVIQGEVLNAGSNVSLNCALTPIPDDAVKTRSEQSAQYNFCFGLGSKQIPAAGTASLKARSNRQVTLGDIILQNITGAPFVQSDDLVITSILIGGLQMLNSTTGAQEVAVTALTAGATDSAGINLGYPINPNTEVEFVIKNYDAANPATVAGAIFCEAWSE